MRSGSQPQQKRPFYCEHCNGKILVPKNLPPTSGPCPHCGHTITSPAFDEGLHAFEVHTSESKDEVLSDEIQVESDPIEPESTLIEEIEPNAGLESVASTKVKKKRKLPIVLAGGLAILGIAIWLIPGFMKPKAQSILVSPVEAEPAEVLDAAYMRDGWIDEARKVLDAFQQATTAEGKMPFVNPVVGLEQRMKDYYEGGVINDADTPASAFQVSDIPEDDRKKGLFWMSFEEIPQTDVREFFRPIMTLEARHGLDPHDASLVLTETSEENLMVPMKVLAFFKHGPDGLKLDWDVYAQTKYRTLRGFTEYPQPDRSVMLRVLVEEDVPDKALLITGTRTYRLTDPVHQSDHAKVNVAVDSEIGRKLSALNWRGTEIAKPLTRTATIELEWDTHEDQPVLRIKRFVCWEFLGLGGKDGDQSISTR